MNLVGLSDGIATTAQTEVDALRHAQGAPDDVKTSSSTDGSRQMGRAHRPPVVRSDG